VTANADGSLQVFGGRAVEVADGLFQWPNAGNYIAFGTDADGKVTHLFVARSAFIRIPWYQAFPVQGGIAGFSLLIFLTGTVGWIVAVARKKPHRRWISGTLSLLNLAFVIGLAVVVAPVFAGSDPPWQLSFDPPAALLILLAIPLLTTVLSIVLLIQVVAEWKGKRGSLVTRIHNTLILLGASAFTFFLHTWNLLGYRL
jgi:hypothetical protein